MAKKYRRPGIVLGLVALAAAVVAAVGGIQQPTGAAAHRAFLKGDADARNVAAQGRNLGSPDSYAAEQLAALAYPSQSLTASVLDNERTYYTTKVKGRSALQSNKGWQLVGPTTSTQPASLNFFDNNLSDLGVSGRVTAIAVSPACDSTSCKVWVAAAGGGVWRSDDALATPAHWKFVSGDFGTNAIGTLSYDAASHTLYAGTGEPNASSDSESGVGIYASTDNGNSWTLLPGSAAAMRARSISSIVADPTHPGTLYVGTTRGVRGVSSVTGGAVSLAPDAAAWGLWKTTDGGQTFSQVWNGAGSIRGVNHVELDSHGTVYAAAFGKGIWRSPDGGATWEQIFSTLDQAPATNPNARTEFALNTTSDGHTRIYVGDGTSSPALTAVYRGDAIDTKTAASLLTGGTNGGYSKLTSDGSTSAGRRDPHYATYNYCETQCWYDNFVVSPAGHPDVVYVGGSFDYSFYYIYGGRAVLLSQDGGATWTDQSTDAQTAATGLHPDQHALAVNPTNPLQFFEGSDGGLIRSSGQVTDNSASCATVFGSYSTACQNLHKAVPTQLATLNQGLSTLQFQNVVVNPSNPSDLMGGTQDNGTWNGSASSSSWLQTIYGDGGVAAYDASNSHFRMNEFYGQYSDVNFRDGDPTAWVIVSAPFFASGEGSAFYKPQIGDPKVSGTSFVGLQSVWRTQDFGGDQATLEANCPEFTTPGNQPGCGDFVALGDPAGQGGPNSPSDLTSGNLGDRAGGTIAALARAASDTGTLWAATSTGRVFISKNADAASTGAVTFTRLDSLSSVDPQRFVSGIVVDPANPNHAWVSYTGYNANTASQPGHVFDVTYDPIAGTATWTNIDNGTGPLGDLPVTGIARDDATGTLYAATDFTVLASSGDGSWQPAAVGMPMVEVAGVTIDPQTRTLYAATHGRGVWSLSLGSKNGK